MIPMLTPIPYGKGVDSTVFDDSFVNEMEKMSGEHGFWARMMSNAIKQAKTESDLSTIVKSMLETRTSSHRDPCRAATKGFRQAFICTSGPFIEVSSVGQKHKAKQAILCSFFERNPTPIQVEEVMDSDNEVKVKQVNICSGTDAAATAPPQPPTAHASATAAP